jgi:hypothetical protein
LAGDFRNLGLVELGFVASKSIFWNTAIIRNFCGELHGIHRSGTMNGGAAMRVEWK